MIQGYNTIYASRCVFLLRTTSGPVALPLLRNVYANSFFFGALAGGMRLRSKPLILSHAHRFLASSESSIILQFLVPAYRDWDRDPTGSRIASSDHFARLPAALAVTATGDRVPGRQPGCDRFPAARAHRGGGRCPGAAQARSAVTALGAGSGPSVDHQVRKEYAAVASVPVFIRPGRGRAPGG